MTAIAGLWRFDGAGGVRPVAERMGAALAAYGPDRDALHEDRPAGIALVWRQKRVTAEDAFDRQPLAGGDGRLWLVADARIDNGDELATALNLPLSGPGRVGDAGLILAAYQRWGTECVDRLTGDFAFALWDGRAGQLLLARDFVGSRPLYFGHGPGFFAFSSMPKGLFAVPGLSSALNEVEIGAYLALLPANGASTFYRDLCRIPQGHYLTVRGETRQLCRYWRPESAPALPVGEYRDHVAELRRLYGEAVRARLRVSAGMGIGSHLSAGFDSSSVTALAANLLAGQGKRLSAFTAAPREGFPVARFYGRPTDETPGAAMLARRFNNIDHRVIRTGPVNALQSLEQYLPYLDQPFLNPCNLTWMAEIEAGAAKERIGVLLSGGLGNMTVSYDGMHHLAQLFRQGRWLRLAGLIVRLWRDGTSFKAPLGAAFGPYLPQFILERVKTNAIRAGERFNHIALSAEFAGRIDIDGIARQRGWDMSYRPWADGRAMRIAVLNWVDQGPYHHATLARHGIDTRDPTTDRRLVDFCLALPERHFLHDGRRSALFRDAMAGLMPPEILSRRIRGYQAADWYEGVVASRQDILAELDRLTTSPLAAEALDLPRMKALAAALPSAIGAADHAALSSDAFMKTHRLALLRGLSVGRFIRMIEGGNG